MFLLGTYHIVLSFKTLWFGFVFFLNSFLFLRLPLILVIICGCFVSEQCFI